MPDKKSTGLDGFLEPRAVALIGVTMRTGTGSYNLLEKMLERRFAGKIYPVNPKGGKILGHQVYKSVGDIHGDVDLAVIITPRTEVNKVLLECAAKGIKNAVVITQGFADASDKAGLEMQREMSDIARRTGIRICGPNTLGVLNNGLNFSTSFVTSTTNLTDTGIICQSGIFLAGAADFSAGARFGMDIGNTCSIDFIEALELIGNDDRVKVVNLHMEGLTDGKKFMEIARSISRTKPVLCLKTGRSEEGVKAAVSHSGSLAGEDHVFDAAFRQCGVIRLNDVEEMHYFNKTFHTYSRMSGPRIAVVTISGGAGIAAIDAVSKYGLELAVFSPETYRTLREVYPDWMSVSNPADIWPAAMRSNYHRILELSLKSALCDPKVDAVLCISPSYSDPEDDPELNTSKIIARVAACHPEKPLAAWVFGAGRSKFAEVVEKEGPVVVYPSPEKAMASLAALYRYHHNIKEAPPDTPFVFNDVEPEKTSEYLKKYRGLPIINEQAFELLKAYGIRTVPSRFAVERKEAAILARELGFPVVMKVSSPQVTHKTDAGGVVLNLKSPPEVEDAYDKMVENVLAKVPGAEISGVILQPQYSGGIEVILGGKRDNCFGPVLVYGLGGIYTELFHDVSFRVAPIGPREALSMVSETRSIKMLKGFRGCPPADINSLLEAIMRLGLLLSDNPEINEIDINPMLAGPTGVIALDARMVIG